MAKRKKTYTPAPEVPQEVMERLARVIEVLAKMRSVSDAARSLDLSRVHFQTMVHRAVIAMVDSLTPKQGGRPAKSEDLRALEAENTRLKKENARLSERAGMTDRLLEVASGLLHGRIQPTRRSTRTKKTKETSGEKASEPDAYRRELLEGVEELMRLGLTAPLAASIAGVDASTIRRWKARERRGAPLIIRLGATRGLSRVSPEVAARAKDLVWKLEGLVGAESLRRAVTELSRREAAQLKREALTELERQRKAAAKRVTITVPNVMRGMDGMHFHSADGPVHALFSADASIPFRTSVTSGTSYDADLVATALEADLEKNGAPLVYRLDRATAHRAPKPTQILDANEILVLHGPPRCARFYGQLERQNRDHRAWEQVLADLPMEMIPARLDEMLTAVNELWCRRTLAWQTPYEAWCARPRLEVDRRELREEVDERAARIGQEMQRRGKPADLARRLAIEKALENRGYLRQEIGGWC